MKRISYALLLALAGLTALWLAADPLTVNGSTFFAVRKLLINYTGVLGIGIMSLGMLLALRPVWLEPVIGGLDKSYRLHKWLGIAGLSLAVIHWLWAKAPKWAVGWGLLTRPQRPRGPRVEADGWFALLQQQRHLAESIGEWAFYALVALLAIALIKRFPYRRFFQTHRLMAAVYLALVVHSVILAPAGYWTSALGPVLALLLAVGSYAALCSLAGRIGNNRRVQGRIAALTPHPDSRVLEVALQLDGSWPGHRAGQFAFVTFDRGEGAHPFTIASAWQGDGRLTFMIKALGDHTGTLAARLAAGDRVTVEGPYGRFDFDGEAQRQIWVAGGIGITPFIARLEALARTPAAQPVDLYFCAHAGDDSLTARLRQLAAAARVNLHLRIAGQQQRLDADGLCRQTPEWRDAQVWFCGPAGFGRSLQRDLCARGLPAGQFHQELFEMR